MATSPECGKGPDQLDRILKWKNFTQWGFIHLLLEMEIIQSPEEYSERGFAEVFDNLLHSIVDLPNVTKEMVVEVLSQQIQDAINKIS